MPSHVTETSTGCPVRLSACQSPRGDGSCPSLPTCLLQQQPLQHPALEPGWLSCHPTRRARQPLLSGFQQRHLELTLAPASLLSWLHSWLHAAEEQLGKGRWRGAAAPGGPRPQARWPPVLLSCAWVVRNRGQHRVASKGLVIWGTVSAQTRPGLCPKSTGQGSPGDRGLRPVLHDEKNISALS